MKPSERAGGIEMVQSFMHTTIATGLLLAGLTLASVTAAAEECEAECPGVDAGNEQIVVNLKDRCMCTGKKCFKVDIGADGPSMTSSGSSEKKIEGCKGGEFQSKPNPNNGYDNDCLKMDIGPNDSVGKWIHKTSGCKDGGTLSTLGCIGVPCEHWVDLVKQTRENTTKLEVCGSQKGRASSGGSNFSGETRGMKPPSIMDAGHPENKSGQK